MCGIYGFTLKTENPSYLLQIMGALQLHRGPDGAGEFLDENIAIGMRRLSIIDLAHGNQPFFNKRRSVTVVCNGEIYNYKELRSELQAKGHVFTTNSDVEVIPFLYDEHGIEFVHKLNGMFAIALYDKDKKQLYLIRDRLGIKPLYYALSRNELIFSSELKSILGLRMVEKELDFEALSTYLELMYIPRPMTPFKNMFKLESASYLLWENNKLQVVNYWDRGLEVDPSLSEDEWLDQIEDVLRSSTNLELRSDVPVGSFLSGGVDSSIVTALAAENSPLGFSTFHMRWKDVQGKIDESAYARMVAERYATKDTTRDIKEIDLIGLLPKLLWHMEEPFADAAFVPTYILSKIAAEKVKVILSGAGGDELFGGYSHHCRQSLVRSLFKKIRYGKNPAMSYYDNWKSTSARKFPSMFPWYAANTFRDQFERKYQANKGKDRIDAIMLADIAYYLQDDILMLTDKMSMAASIECRVPLLDHRLVELSLKIPASFKVKDGEKKYILKKLGEKYLPHEVMYRQKEGFGSPVWIWIQQYKELYFDRILENGHLVQSGLIDKRRLSDLIFKVSLNKAASWFYWQILVLEIWCRLFIDDVNHDDIFQVAA